MHRPWISSRRSKLLSPAGRTPTCPWRPTARTWHPGSTVASCVACARAMRGAKCKHSLGSIIAKSCTACEASMILAVLDTWSSSICGTGGVAWIGRKKALFCMQASLQSLAKLVDLAGPFEDLTHILGSRQSHKQIPSSWAKEYLSRKIARFRHSEP